MTRGSTVGLGTILIGSTLTEVVGMWVGQVGEDGT